MPGPKKRKNSPTGGKATSSEVDTNNVNTLMAENIVEELLKSEVRPENDNYLIIIKCQENLKFEIVMTFLSIIIR